MPPEALEQLQQFCRAIWQPGYQAVFHQEAQPEAHWLGWALRVMSLWLQQHGLEHRVSLARRCQMLMQASPPQRHHELIGPDPLTGYHDTYLAKHPQQLLSPWLILALGLTFLHGFSVRFSASEDRLRDYMCNLTYAYSLLPETTTFEWRKAPREAPDRRKHLAVGPDGRPQGCVELCIVR